jgi:hypothetical protein
MRIKDSRPLVAPLRPEWHCRLSRKGLGGLVVGGGFEVSVDDERGMLGHALRGNIGGMTRESTELIFP